MIGNHLSWFGLAMQTIDAPVRNNKVSVKAAAKTRDRPKALNKLGLRFVKKDIVFAYVMRRPIMLLNGRGLKLQNPKVWNKALLSSSSVALSASSLCTFSISFLQLKTY